MLIIFLSLIFLSYVPDWENLTCSQRFWAFKDSSEYQRFDICAYLRYLRFKGLEGKLRLRLPRCEMFGLGSRAQRFPTQHPSSVPLPAIHERRFGAFQLLEERRIRAFR